jgi:6-phosphogluconolactonase
VGLSAREAATAYEATLRQFYGGGQLNARRPLFDLTLLGIGADGHTASLFPNQRSLDERRRWVLDVTSPTGDPRITLTFPPLESSREIVFLATGARKQRTCPRLVGRSFAAGGAGCTPAAACTGFSIARPIPPKV